MSHVWLVTVGEHLPVRETDVRLMRTGLLARHLARRGHRVTWWTSAFEHSSKTVLPASRLPGPFRWEGGEIRFLRGRPYTQNVSWQRLVNHGQLGRDFARLVDGEEAPDAILCSLPTLELCAVAVHYGRRQGVPVWLDVRDLWPDLWTLALPQSLRMLSNAAVHPYRRLIRRALQGATGIVAITPGYLAWGLEQAGRSQRPEDLVAPITYELPALTPEQLAAARATLASRGVDWNCPLAVSVGSLGRTCDLTPLIETARLLNVAMPEVQFVVAGGGDRTKHWRDRAAGVPNIVFTGWLHLAEVSALLQGATAGIAAYAARAPQSIPNKVVESLAYGVPLFSSLQGESARLLEGTGAGVQFNIDDPSSLAVPLMSLLRDSEVRAASSRAARKVFAERFDAAAIHASIERLLIGGSGRGGS